MAKYKAPRPDVSKQLHFKGSGDVLALYSDAFFIATEQETGMGSLYFYQREIGDQRALLGTTQTGIQSPTARCISHIVMSHAGIDKLLHALASNLGYTLTRIREEKK